MSAGKLPRWQADRLATLLDALGGISVTDAERRSLAWLAGFEAATVENVAAVMRRLTARSETNWTIEAAGWLRQQHALCDAAGIDAGKDPYAALLAHLRGREPGGAS